MGWDGGDIDFVFRGSCLIPRREWLFIRSITYTVRSIDRSPTHPLQSQSSRHIKRRVAAKGIELRLRIDDDQILHRGPNAQPHRRQRPHQINHIPHIQPPPPGHKPARQPPHANVQPRDAPRDGIEPLPLTGPQGVLAHREGEVQEGREGVGELDDAGRADDGGEAAEVGDRGPDDEGQAPVDGDERRPELFAGAVRQGGEVQELDGYVVVEDWGLLLVGFFFFFFYWGEREGLAFDADVAVERGGD